MANNHPPWSIVPSRLDHQDEEFEGEAELVISQDVKHSTLPESRYWSTQEINSDVEFPKWRNCHSAVMQHGTKMIIFGGMHKKLKLNDCFQCDVITSKWTEIKAPNPPPARYCHTATLYKDRYMIVFGGIGELGQRFNDVAVLDLDRQEWLLPSTHGTAPEPRSHHGAVLHEHKLLIFGGLSGVSAQRLNTVHYLDLSKKPWVWFHVNTSGTPPIGRLYPTLTVWRNNLVVFAGYTGSQRLNDIHMLELRNLYWSEPTTKGDPCEPRYGHSGTQIGSKLFVFGGNTDTSYYENHSYMIDFETMEWKQLTLLDSPVGRRYHTAVLSESTEKLYIYGGSTVSKIPETFLFVLDANMVSELGEWTFDEAKHIIQLAIRTFSRSVVAFATATVAAEKNMINNSNETQTGDSISQITSSASSSLLLPSSIPISSSGQPHPHKPREKLKERSLSSSSASRDREKDKEKEKDKETTRRRKKSKSELEEKTISIVSSPRNSSGPIHSVSSTPPTQHIGGPTTSNGGSSTVILPSTSPSSPQSINLLPLHSTDTYTISPPLSPNSGTTAGHSSTLTYSASSNNIHSTSLQSSSLLSQNSRYVNSMEGQVAEALRLLKLHFRKLKDKQRALRIASEQLLKQQKHFDLAVSAASKYNESHSTDKIIKLNVGGTLFQTTLATLTSYPDSMLGAMFSGKYKLQTDENGNIFIDRDGTNFRYILNYLRTGRLTAPQYDIFILTEIKQEAEYYQLHGLLDQTNEKLSLLNQTSIPIRSHTPHGVNSYLNRPHPSSPPEYEDI